MIGGSPQRLSFLSVITAHSWYFFHQWPSTNNTKFSFIFPFRLSEAGFPTQLLPTVIRAGETAGCIQSSWYCIPEGTPVGAALGDLQCSILSCSPHSEDAGGWLTVSEFLLDNVWTVVVNYLLAHNRHYSDVIMGVIASQITSLTIVYSTVYSGADQRKLESSTLLAFVWGIHRGPVNSPHKWPVTRKMFPLDDAIMDYIGVYFR